MTRDVRETKRNDEMIRYSKQLEMLNKLQNLGVISAVEYQKILDNLKRDYHVVSNLLT